MPNSEPVVNSAAPLCAIWIGIPGNAANSASKTGVVATSLVPASWPAVSSTVSVTSELITRLALGPSSSNVMKDVPEDVSESAAVASVTVCESVAVSPSPSVTVSVSVTPRLAPLSSPSMIAKFSNTDFVEMIGAR